VARGDCNETFGDSIFMDLAGESAEKREGGVSILFTDPEAKEEPTEFTDAVDDLRIPLREIEESRAGFRIDDVEAEEEIVLPAYRGVFED
jgi:hypothetical protein